MRSDAVRTSLPNKMMLDSSGHEVSQRREHTLSNGHPFSIYVFQSQRADFEYILKKITVLVTVASYMLNTVHPFCHQWCFCQRPSCHSSLLHQLCDHVDVEAVEVSEKVSFQCRLSHSNRSWITRSHSSLCLGLYSFGMNVFSLPSFLRTLFYTFVVFSKSR